MKACHMCWICRGTRLVANLLEGVSFDSVTPISCLLGPKPTARKLHNTVSPDYFFTSENSNSDKFSTAIYKTRSTAAASAYTSSESFSVC